ncbi:hypothetical protein CLU95_4704 [Variovorax sp. 54]|uniref:hypothetical protein n=1 Tax=Variovorax sp. 54 TaxID=2035212 RepID=UPI000C17482B|nr:hypothetical protein [Variovorax sp. 54]PIF77529.1 hypothetical protein CLU95_4704 [Variovorax sp. 54]
MLEGLLAALREVIAKIYRIRHWAVKQQLGDDVHIDDDHLYHGAALIQIAESLRFTAINSLKIAKRVLGMGYLINDDVAVYLKYASEPNEAHEEYVFTFAEGHLSDLEKTAHKYEKTFIALVCVQEREICCISYAQLMELKAAREKSSGQKEGVLAVLVTAPKKKQLRVGVNAAHQKNNYAKVMKVARNAFPEVIFE